ncbi:hypothetical protein CL618_03170 [archaeon]|nr:hypothetical protein [archaeon]
MMDANSIDLVEESFADIDISEEDEEEIKELAKDPRINERLLKSIAPSIYGHNDIKEALILQLVGGVQKEREDGIKTRGDMHILLIGDPGAGKSALLSFISKIAPKGRLVSGKGVSSAGLCVAPESTVMLNPGELTPIQEIVEPELHNNSKDYIKGIQISKNPTKNKKLYSLTKDLKIKSSYIDQFWKIKPPKKMVNIKTQSGKELILTGKTKLLTINKGEISWKESNELKEDDYIASARSVPSPDNKKMLAINLIKSNPVIYGVKKEVNKMIKRLMKKYKLNKRQLAKKLNLNEDKLYYNWINEKARGNPHLDDVKRLATLSKTSLDKIAHSITGLSLRKGHIRTLPKYLDEDFMYFAGLIAGDGNLSGNPSKRVTVGFTNNDKLLQKEFKNLSKKLFSAKVNISSKKSTKRGEGWRFSSKLVFEVLNGIGIPLSPKSHRLDMNDNLLSLPKKLIASFLRGFYDADGSVIQRKNGSNNIELTTSSENIAKKIQLVLLRFGIHSRIRKRKTKKSIKKDGGIINPKLYKFTLTISGLNNIKLFKETIGFKISHKLEKINSIVKSTKEGYTNVDSTPEIGIFIRKIIKKHKLTTKQVFGYKTSNYFINSKNFTKNRLEKTYNNLKQLIPKNDPDLKILKRITHSDIFWEKIRSKKLTNHNYKYVYDLTVKNSHNFLVNGFIVHNTASVVRDEFLKGWALEAGALVLSSGGTCIIDEMDKIHPDDTAAMHQALEQQIVTISKANIQACYSSDTEVLTNEGWKKYQDVKNLKIAQFNPKNKTIQFLPHKGLYEYDCTGKMYNFKNKRNDILVTPNHKMLAKEYSQKEYKEITAENLKYNTIHFLNSGNFIGKEEKYFTLPPIKHKQNRKHPKYTHQHKSKKIPMNLWLEFLGYFLSEGGLQREPTLGIPQEPGENCNKIRKCLSKLSKYVGFTLTESKDQKYSRFQITNTQLFRFLETNCGKKCNEKKYPLDLSSLSKKQLKILYNALMLGDGCSKGKYYSSTSIELTDLFQSIACLIGRSANKGVHYKAYGNRQTCYRVTLCDKINPSIKNKFIKKIEYNGKVFCFSTKTGFFLTRRNGKIAIQGNTLKTETTVLAAANPKLGRFDPYKMVAEQIELPPTLINRFDLIFPVKDIPTKEKDEQIASHVLTLQQKPSSLEFDIPMELLRKYVAYVKQKIKPKLSDNAVDEIKNFYVTLRNQETTSDDALRPIPITARQLEGLVRLAEASAKLRLSKTVTRSDAKRAIKLLKNCLMQVGFDQETGQIDIDRMTTTISASQRGKISLLRSIVEQLEEKVGKTIPLEDVTAEAEEKGITEDKVEEIIERMKREGLIFEPKTGFIQRI